MKRTMLLLSVSFSSTFCFSQIKTDSINNKRDSSLNKSYFKFDFNYINNSVYLGRKDSLNLPYFSPTISYHNKSGIYASLSLGYLLATEEKRIDYYSLDAGYDFNITKKFTGSFSANKRVYNDSSNNISSDIGGSASADFSYDFNWLELDFGGGASFAYTTDYDLNIGINKSFYIGPDNKQWAVSPLIKANFSTLHFYEGYTSKKIGKKITKKNANIASITSITKVDKNKLALMDFEFSIPISYDEKHWGFYLTPTISVPQNSINTTTVSTIKLRNGSTNIITTDSTPDSEKTLSNSFYVELGMYFKL